MANDKHWRSGLPSNSSRGSSRSPNRRNGEDTTDRYVDDNAESSGENWRRPEDSRRSRPEQSGRHRDEAGRRSRPRQDDRSRTEDSDRYPPEESRRSRPRKESRYRDVDDEWKRAEKNWKPPIEASASYPDSYDDNDSGSRKRSGDSHRSRPEYRDYQPYPESSERRGRNSGKLAPRYDDYDEPGRSGSSASRRSRYDDPERSSSPSNRRSQYDEPERTRPSLWGDEPERTKPSLWGDESELQPAVSPLWAGDPVAHRELSRRNRNTARFDESKPKKWWHLPNFKDPYDRRRSMIWSLVVGLLIVVCILPSFTFVGVFALYKHASNLATDGVAHLEQGGNLMKELGSGNVKSSVTSEALEDFQKAHSDFSQLQSTVARIPGFAGSIPKYGSEIASAEQLVPIAVEASQMAVLGTDALNILLADVSNPFAKTGEGLTTADMQTITSDFQQVVALFNTVAGQIQQLSPASLTFNAKLGADITKVKAELPKAQKYIQLANKVLTLLPSLLGVGTPTTYMIEVLDSTELRPGGGFLGNYGVLTLSGGRITLKVTDVDLLDRGKCFKKTCDQAPASIPFPTEYNWFAQDEGQVSWSVRDSNLEANFPTDAIYALQNYQLEAAGLNQCCKGPAPTQFQGVMAVTPFLVEDLMAITGNITVPAPYNQTVTPSNLIDAIHYAQLGPGHGSDFKPAPGTNTSQRKAFTGALFKQLMAKVVSLSTTKRSAFIELALKSLQNKNLQVYLGNATTPSPAEALLQQFNVASTIQAPTTGDSLFIVDGNFTGNKQSQNIDYMAADAITIGAQGTVTHNLTLTYNWPYTLASTNNTYGNYPNDYLYVDHVRIYVPPKAALTSMYYAVQAGGGSWVYDGVDSGNPWDFNRELFVGDLNLSYPDQLTIYMSWTVPGAAVERGHTWTYQLLDQRQAGIFWTQNTTITLPSCAKVTSLSELKAGPKNTVTVTGQLKADTTYAVSYICAR